MVPVVPTSSISNTCWSVTPAPAAKIPRTHYSRWRTSLTERGATVLRELTPIKIAPETIGTAAEAVAEQVTAVSDEETLSELEDGGIVQTKAHKVAPMTVEEA